MFKSITSVAALAAYAQASQVMHKRGESTEEWCTRIGAMVGRSGEEL